MKFKWEIQWNRVYFNLSELPFKPPLNFPRRQILDNFLPHDCYHFQKPTGNVPRLVIPKGTDFSKGIVVPKMLSEGIVGVGLPASGLVTILMSAGMLLCGYELECVVVN